MSGDVKRKDGTGSYFKTSQGWVAQVRVWDEAAGKSKQVRRRAKSRDHARQILKDLQGESAASTSGTEMTVVSLLEVWRDRTLPRRGLAASTIAQYTNLITTPLIPTLDKTRLSKFTPLEAEAWLGRLDSFKRKDGKPLSQSTKRSAFAVLSLALDTAVRDDLIDTNPLTSVARPRKSATSAPVMSADEVDAVVAAAVGTDIEGLVTFLAFTGCRLGEALSLRWDDVDLDAQQAQIVRSGVDSDSTKTAAGKRAVPLLPEVMPALRAEKVRQATVRLQLGEGYEDAGLVFPSRVGSAMDPHNARRQMRRVLKAAGLPEDRPFHTMRHSLATRLLNRGVPMVVVAKLLGHASIRTTVDIYGHAEPAISAEALAAAVAR